ncbi:MAG: HlyC/CorC family transporter [Burkholderiales bacterium]
MNDPPKPGWFERLSVALLRKPEDRDHLIELLRFACEKKIMDAEALSMILGVLHVSETTVRDIMIPRSQMEVIDASDPPEKFIPYVIETAHSRFPVIGENRDDVLGILLAKDLLRYTQGQDFDLKKMLRPAVFVPESKRVNVLLKEFRTNRNHIALAVDEYGGVSGLVTIEDVLEEIVGEIEDEFDLDESKGNIMSDGAGHYRVKAMTEINDFNEAFNTDYSNEDYDTVGGLVLSEFGRMPKRGEKILLDGLSIQVLRADGRRLDSLLVEKVQDSGAVPAKAGNQ